MTQEGLRKGHSLGVLGVDGLGGSSQSNSPTVSQESLAQMNVIGGLNGVRAPVVETLCLERRLVEVILGVAPLAEARGKFGPNESLLEEASKYSHSETCSFLSLGGRGSFSFSFCGEKKEVVVADWDLVAFEWPYYVSGEGSIDSLRVIRADGSKRGVSIDMEEGAKEYDGRALPVKDVKRVLEEEEVSVLGS